VHAHVVGPAELPEEPTLPVVVIDVLRAFTTAAHALAGGASPLLLAASDEEALALKEDLGPAALALKDGEIVPGFDLGNSPGQVRRAALHGRPVVMRTTNGTVAVHRSMRAPTVLAASLVNASATARAVRATGAEAVIYVVTGDDGRAEEDLACADLVHALVTDQEPPTTTVERVRSSAAAAALADGLARGFRGVGADDVDLATEVDRFDVAMVAGRDRGVVRLSPSPASDVPLDAVSGGR
jgi:2-phosphosulfolactate phosphatase